MKTRKAAVALSICLLGLTVFPACLEVNTTSQVNSDGSILRTITFDDDSTSIYRGNFPIPMDSTWQKSFQKLEEKKFRLTASRLFRDVNEMNVYLKGTFGKTFQFRFEFEKSFQWFFTVYRFKEINLKYNQFDAIPLTDYVSQDEIDRQREHEIEKKPYATKGDSLSLKAADSRFEEWAMRNIFESVFVAFLQGVRNINDPGLAPSAVERLKDTLYARSEQSIARSNIDTLRIIFGKVLRRSLVDKAWQSNADGFKEIHEKLAADFGGSYVTSILMPGLITNSNAPTIEGNKATWRDFKDFAKYLGYTMSIESKQVNWWAVILTGLLVLSLMGLTVASVVRKRRSF